MWVSVKERLPEEGVKVLGWDTTDGAMVIACTGKSTSEKIYWYMEGDVGTYYFACITHWQPLPPPPKEEG